ncbi:hypothetical protein [Streptomyces sp. NPDC018055]|uniref:hypothetical protein n=1 Tax=Streptomyces sp. NPDC018055 TaxID=3365038 RepID=UPI0037A853E0
MGRSEIPKKETPSQRRTRLALEADAATGDQEARRGESDDVEKGTPASAGVPPQASAPEGVVRTSAEVEADEAWDAGFRYAPPPGEADLLTRLAHAKNGIARANRSLTVGMGMLSSHYVLSAGRHLWDVIEDKSFKAANLKSVEAFAATVGLTKQDVYRLRRAVPVYAVLGNMIEEPLNERTVRELYKNLTDENKNVDWDNPKRQADCRAVFTEMKRRGQISSTGAIAARKLLALGEATELIEEDPAQRSNPAVSEQLEKARKQNRVLDAETVKALAEEDPGAVKEYVLHVRARYEALAALIPAE